MRKILIALFIGVMLALGATYINVEIKQKEIAEQKLRNQELERQKLEQQKEEELRKLEEQKRIEEEERTKKEQEKIKEQNRIASVGFDTGNLLKPSNITESEMYELLKGTGLEDVADALVLAEKRDSVNAFIIAALAAEESGWGNSTRATGQNNLTGHAVYKSASRGTTFSSRDESVLSTVRLIKKYYLNPNGDYYNGVSLRSVNIKYSANPNWSSNIEKIASELRDEYIKKFR